jgi:ATP-binding cassette subfamily B protein
MKEKPTVVPSVEEPVRIPLGMPHTIEFVNVSFAYPGSDHVVLKNINLKFRPGETVVRVGLNGAGKTTFIKLLTRLYDPTEGKILLDGRDLREYDLSDLYRIFGIIFQDFGKYAFSISENISFGDIHRPRDEEAIRRAARESNADDFITRLPNGYDTALTANGSQLSQGQRQLIAIARAAVADPPVMILDEATSSIDTRTEALVQKGMDALMQGRTTFVIAHRLSTVQNSDCIMVLDHGRIIERGTHDDLIAQKGTYYQLYTGAFELE